jgi:hypothetical protein
MFYYIEHNTVDISNRSCLSFPILVAAHLTQLEETYDWRHNFR